MTQALFFYDQCGISVRKMTCNEDAMKMIYKNRKWLLLSTELLRDILVTNIHRFCSFINYRSFHLRNVNH